MLEHFTRKGTDTHCVIYSAIGGELLVSYWDSLSAARRERLHILSLGGDHARIESLAELDALEGL